MKMGSPSCDPYSGIYSWWGGNADGAHSLIKTVDTFNTHICFLRVHVIVEDDSAELN